MPKNKTKAEMDLATSLQKFLCADNHSKTEWNAFKNEFRCSQLSVEIKVNLLLEFVERAEFSQRKLREILDLVYSIAINHDEVYLLLDVLHQKYAGLAREYFVNPDSKRLIYLFYFDLCLKISDLDASLMTKLAFLTYSKFNCSLVSILERHAFDVEDFRAVINTVLPGSQAFIKEIDHSNLAPAELLNLLANPADKISVVELLSKVLGQRAPCWSALLVRFDVWLRNYPKLFSPVLAVLMHWDKFLYDKGSFCGLVSLAQKFICKGLLTDQQMLDIFSPIRLYRVVLENASDNVFNKGSTFNVTSYIYPLFELYQTMLDTASNQQLIFEDIIKFFDPNNYTGTEVSLYHIGMSFHPHDVYNHALGSYAFFKFMYQLHEQGMEKQAIQAILARKYFAPNTSVAYGCSDLFIKVLHSNSSVTDLGKKYYKIFYLLQLNDLIPKRCIGRQLRAAVLDHILRMDDREKLKAFALIRDRSTPLSKLFWIRSGFFLMHFKDEIHPKSLKLIEAEEKKINPSSKASVLVINGDDDDEHKPLLESSFG